MDHDTEYVAGATEPGAGATHPDNLHVMHRGHHNAKTGRFWSSAQHGDGSITWQTLTRRLRTSGFDHHQDRDQCPPRVSVAEQQVGIRLALCREHDVIPNVFTDLADLRLLRDEDTELCRQIPGRVQFYRPRRPIRVVLPDPPPPF